MGTFPAAFSPALGCTGGLEAWQTHRPERSSDLGDSEPLLLEEEDEAEDGGDGDFRAERNALIFGGAEARWYSSIRFARSSSDVTDTSASRSSVGNWHLRFTEAPHISASFTTSSANRGIEPKIYQ
ncbi:ragB/susD domain protein [Striga asiatica]|uniref:RagB/susD domain protein n=1 Tax=Striga asiatica TaxID=4170 RepID=A0A5A7R5D1_STRAF|nr:ragB/susD domain protein [Striga asiatica]